MTLPSNAVYYNGFYYSITMYGNGTPEWEWVVYDAAGTEQTRGISSDGNIAKASAVDYIDSTESSDPPIPDWDDEFSEIAQGEESFYSNDYTDLKCVSQTKSWLLDFITIRGVPGGSQAKLNIKKNSGGTISMPVNYRMKIQIQIEATSFVLADASYSESVNVALESNDYLDVMNDDNNLVMSLIQNGQEVISSANLETLNQNYARFEISMTMTSFQICHAAGEDNGDNGNGNGNGDEGVSLSQDQLWMILGGLMLLLILGYIWNTTAGDGG